MATPILDVPGVYLQEKVTQTTPTLPTGVPAFVGFVLPGARVPDGAPQTETLYGPVALHRKSDFPGDASVHLNDAITGFFDNGGGYCYVVGIRVAPTIVRKDGKIVAQFIDASDASASAKLIAALDLLSPLADVDLVAVPDTMALKTPAQNSDDPPSPADLAIRAVQSAMIIHCTNEGTRIALLDPLPGALGDDIRTRQLQPLTTLLGTDLNNAAMYHPWIRTLTSGSTPVPPCGHIAGIISKTDNDFGVFKPPANIEILGVTDIDTNLDTGALAGLNAEGVNCLRAFPSRGIRVWGARTLSKQAEWRYLNVRRLVLTTLRWIDANMTWATFEPNVPALWSRIQRELTAYLRDLWRAGALQGADEREAFFVKCDAELNPPDARERGELFTRIGLAPTVPAEFIVVSVQHRAGTTELI